MSRRKPSVLSPKDVADIIDLCIRYAGELATLAEKDMALAEARSEAGVARCLESGGPRRASASKR